MPQNDEKENTPRSLTWLSLGGVIMGNFSPSFSILICIFWNTASIYSFCNKIGIIIMSKMLRGKTLKAIEKFLLSHVRKPFGCVIKGSWGRGGEERGGLWVGRRPSPGTDLHCARCCIISDNLQSLFLEPWTGGWGGGGGRGAMPLKQKAGLWGRPLFSGVDTTNSFFSLELQNGRIQCPQEGAGPESAGLLQA